jgi:hypothetical protein
MLTADERTARLEDDIAEMSRAVVRRLEVIARKSADGYTVTWECPTCGHQKETARRPVVRAG